jgi:hypothetical protein
MNWEREYTWSPTDQSVAKMSVYGWSDYANSLVWNICSYGVVSLTSVGRYRLGRKFTCWSFLLKWHLTHSDVFSFVPFICVFLSNRPTNGWYPIWPLHSDLCCASITLNNDFYFFKELVYFDIHFFYQFLIVQNNIIRRNRVAISWTVRRIGFP